jgi:hypothetical protein
MSHAGYEGRDPLPQRSIFAGVIPILIGIAVALVLLFTFFYQRCSSAFWDNLLDYPGSTRVYETAQFLSTQQRILLSPDSAGAIERWYAAQAAAEMRQAVTSGDFSTLSRVPAFVLIADPGGAGTRIVFTTTCP